MHPTVGAITNPREQDHIACLTFLKKAIARLSAET
jgi:hypothetical protein